MLGTQKKVETAQALNFNSAPTKITETHHSLHNVQKFQETSQSFMEVDNAYRFSREAFNYGTGSATYNRQILGVQNTTALYEDIALPDVVLSDYYSQVLLLF